MKKCTRCNIEKNPDCFGKGKRYKDGLRSWCKQCYNDYRVERYRANPEKGRLQSREWRIKNPDKAREIDKRTRSKLMSEKPELVRQWDKDRYQRDKIKRIAYQKQYAAKNRESRNSISRTWAAKNKENRNYHTGNRRAMRLQATPIWANQSYIKLFYSLAKIEADRIGKQVHVDHIVPLKSDTVCGLHCEHNLQLVIYDENIRKSNKWWPEMPTDHGRRSGAY